MEVPAERSFFLNRAFGLMKSLANLEREAPRAETVHKLPLFLNVDASFRRLDFTSGKSAKMANSLIAFVVRTSNRSRSQVSGNLHD